MNDEGIRGKGRGHGVIQSNEKFVVTVGVAMFNSQKGVMYFGPRMAVAALSALPLMLMFIFLQKYIVASVALSGLKQ